jgi:hypothetical protein
MNAKIIDQAAATEPDTTPSSEFDALLRAPGSQTQPVETEADEAQADEAQTNPAQIIEADIDGRRVRIVAQDEIVLECGNASITLRRNGRIVIKGTYVETCSEGTNRIKGGQVRIN